MRIVKLYFICILFMCLCNCAGSKEEVDKMELNYENAWGQETILDTVITGSTKNYLKPNYLWFSFLPSLSKKDIEAYLRKDKAILFDTLNISHSYQDATHVIVKIDTSISSVIEIINKYIKSEKIYYLNYVYANEMIKEPCENVDYISCSNIFELKQINHNQEALDSLLTVTKSKLWAKTDSTIKIETDKNSVGDAFYVRSKFIESGFYSSDKIFTRSWYSLSDVSYSDISIGDYCLYFH